MSLPSVRVRQGGPPEQGRVTGKQIKEVTQRKTYVWDIGKEKGKKNTDDETETDPKTAPGKREKEKADDAVHRM